MRVLSTIRQSASRIKRELSLDPDKARRTAGAVAQRPLTTKTTPTTASQTKSKLSLDFEKFKSKL